MVLQPVCKNAIPYLDMGGAHIKINDDGSFNLQVMHGLTGSDTVLHKLLLV